MLYVYVLYELRAASLHQIYLLLWVLAENFDSCWAAGMWRNQHTLLLVACDECHAPSQPLSTHRWPQAWPVFTGQGLPLGPWLPGALEGGHIPVCPKVSGSASFLLPVLLLSSEFWLLENHSVFPCFKGFCLLLSVKLNTWLHAFSPLKYIKWNKLIEPHMPGALPQTAYTHWWSRLFFLQSFYKEYFCIQTWQIPWDSNLWGLSLNNLEIFLSVLF